MSYDDVATSGHEVRWVEWTGEHPQQLHLRWENQGWVAEGVVGRERVALGELFGRLGRDADANAQLAAALKLALGELDRT